MSMIRCHPYMPGTYYAGDHYACKRGAFWLAYTLIRRCDILCRFDSQFLS